MVAVKQTENKLLMPKATAVWLIENTILTFKQVAEFVGLTEIEVEALANEDIGRGLVGRDPIEHSELTKEELARCEEDPHSSLILATSDLPQVKNRSKGPRYTPVSKRGDKPDAIAYIIKYDTDMSDAQICRLVGTTKPTINNVRERTHPNTPNIRPRHPADLGLCSYTEYEKAVEKALKAAGKDPEAVKAQKAAEYEAQQKAQDDSNGDDGSHTGGFDFSNFMGEAGRFSSNKKKESDD